MRAPGRTSDPPALPSRQGGSRLGIALGGGAVLGYSHIGVLTALEEAELLPGAIAGTSAGAIAAAADKGPPQ